MSDLKKKNGIPAEGSAEPAADITVEDLAEILNDIPAEEAAANGKKDWKEELKESLEGISLKVKAGATGGAAGEAAPEEEGRQEAPARSKDDLQRELAESHRRSSGQRWRTWARLMSRSARSCPAVWTSCRRVIARNWRNSDRT